MLAFSRFVLASSLVSSALAVVHTVAVGKDGLKFTPDSVNANPGDEVIFEFYPKNHTVTQSTLKDPCTAVPAGGDSGFMFVSSTATLRPTKRIVVADSTTPLWFFCKQADHCSKGMVFAINPKSEDQMKEYRANALATAATTPQPAGTTPPATTTPKVIPVTVGDNGALKFVPEQVTAAVGDTIQLTFKAGAHTFTQSTFADPCDPLAGGVDSGSKPAAGITPSPTFNFTVTDASKPLWFYCKTGTHCKSGMVFSINAPATGNTHEKYVANAKSSAPATQPAGTTPPATTTPKVIPVTVGDNGALKFVPEQVTAAVGDTIQLTFKAGAHTFTQSTFADPCDPLAGGVDSGSKPAAGITPSPTFNFTVTDASKPLWFYCKTGTHCKSGMVFSINAPATGNTHEKYVANAKSSAQAPASATTSTSASATPTPSTPAGGAATGKDIAVTVGKDNTLTFEPANVSAAVGDTIVLTFVSGAHTFTQSSFTEPCNPLAAGVDSGSKPAAGLAVSPTFNYTVTDASKPLWFYCKTGRHCQAGMVFSINAPATGNTHEKFVENAKNGSAAGASASTTAAPAPAPTADSQPPSDSSSAPSTPEAPNTSKTSATNTTPSSSASGLVASTSSVLFAAVLAGLLL